MGINCEHKTFFSGAMMKERVVDVLFGWGPSLRVRHGRRNFVVLAASPRALNAAAFSVLLLNANGEANPACTRHSCLMSVFS